MRPRSTIAAAAALLVTVSTLLAADAGSGAVSWAQTDVRVSDPDALFPGAEKNLYEPVIAIDPTDPMRMVAFAIDLSSQNAYPYDETGHWSNNRRFRSTDGGVTWTALGPMPYAPEPGAIDGGDPVVFFHADGVAHFAGLSDPPDPEEYRRIYVYRSIDAGASWSDPVLAFRPLKDLEADVCESVDKQWLSPGRTASELLLTYTKVTFTCSLIAATRAIGLTDLGLIADPRTDIGIYLKRSSDGGLTWGPEQRLWDGYALGSVPRVGPDGELHVVFWASATTTTVPCASAAGAVLTQAGQGPFGSIVVASSADDGATWTHHRQSTCSPEFASLWKPGIYAGGNLMPTISRDASTGIVYVAYPTFRTAENRFAVEVITSTDRGGTWSAPVEVSRAPDEGHLPALFAADGVARLVYVINRPDGTGDTLYSESADGGTTWSAPVELSSQPAQLEPDPDIGDYFTVDVRAGRIAAIWTDARHGFPTEIWSRVGWVQ